MKYLLTIILISCLTVVNAQATLKYNTVASKLIDKGQEWKEAEWKDVDVFLSVVTKAEGQQGRVKVYTDTPQVYDLIHISKTGKDEEGSWIIWYAEDRDGTNCHVKLKLWKDEDNFYDQLYVFYSTFSFVYAINSI